MQSSTASVKRKSLYVYIPGLYPYGLLYAPQVAGALLTIKGKDAIIYQRRSTDLKTELSNFNHFIEIFKRNYNTFIIIGHSYGAVYAKYFSANIPGSVYVSLDGSDLKETCAYIAYDLLNIDRSKKIDYTGEYPVCDGHNLVKEWFAPTIKATIKDYGKNILEVSWQEWVRNTKTVDKLHPANSLIFTYYPNPKEPSKVSIVKRNSVYEVHYGKSYSHSLHMDPTVCSAILKIIDTKAMMRLFIFDNLYQINMDCSTIVIVIILIAVAILLYFSITDKDTFISGGHEVKHNGKNLHIENFKALKRKLKELYPSWNPEQIHEEADRIVADFLKQMDPTLGYHEQAKYIDDRIAEYIKN